MEEKLTKSVESCSRLSIELGTEMTIEIEGVASRFKSALIGMETNSFVLARTPQIIDGGFEIKCHKFRGSKVVTRYLYRGSVFGFTSKLLGIVSEPIKLIVVEYPKVIEECNLRRHKRLSCLLSAKVKSGNSVFDVTIIDISEAGCQIMIVNPKVVKINMFDSNKSKDEIIHIMVNLPGVHDKFIIPGEIKAVRKDPDKVKIGMQFSEMDKKTKSFLIEFIEKSANVLAI